MRLQGEQADLVYRLGITLVLFLQLPSIQEDRAFRKIEKLYFLHIPELVGIRYDPATDFMMFVPCLSPGISGGQKMDPTDVHVKNSRTSECMALHRGEDFADVI